MSHPIALSVAPRHAQLGQLAERPSPSRIAAYAFVIALHVAALVLLLMPMAPPEAPRALETVTDPFWIKPRTVVPPPPPPPTETRRLPQTDTPPRPVPMDQPAVVVEDSPLQAPPPDPTPDTATVIETVTPPGPIAAAQLEYASAPPPPYPRDAVRRRLEGTVLLEVLVDVDGTPLDVRVHTSSGHRSLDDTARAHVLKRWRFKPATQEGRAVQSVGLVPVKFTLQ